MLSLWSFVPSLCCQVHLYQNKLRCLKNIDPGPAHTLWIGIHKTLHFNIPGDFCRLYSLIVTDMEYRSYISLWYPVALVCSIVFLTLPKCQSYLLHQIQTTSKTKAQMWVFYILEHLSGYFSYHRQLNKQLLNKWIFEQTRKK